MLNKLHPEIGMALINGGFLAQSAEMEKNIGRIVRFAPGRPWRAGDGTATRDFTYTIIGVQRIYNGTIAYRATCNDGADNVGRPFLPTEIEFI